ncbi:EAL domain-containing protein [Planomonospora corallina]|uniref:EAL domain-containing protein n=1 Tax=Planomonospora corallina TaxID=1806052 RepID=A0ABV8I7J1_9ACTN
MSEDRSTRWILWERDPRPPQEPQGGRTLWERKDSAFAGASATLAAPVSVPAPAPAADRLATLPAPELSPVQARFVHEQPLGISQYTELIHEIIDRRLVEVVFQPIVDLAHDQVVGFEALSRGPRNSPLRTPDRLFAAARAVGRAGELDWICRAEAFRQMLQRKMPATVSLFVNVDAASLIVECPEDLLPIVWEATRELRVFIEIDGEAMNRHPQQVLETVRRARAARWGVSVGEIEFSPAGQGMLPVLEPDVVKIDHRLLTYGRAYAGQALTAVLSEAKSSGATLLVENVENQAGALTGRSLGGTYQRGFFHGRPGELPAAVPPPKAPIRLRELPSGPAVSPWNLVVQSGAHVSGGLRWEEINELTPNLAAPIVQSSVAPVVAFLLPESGWSTEMAVIYSILLARCPLVLVLGADVAKYGNWRVRGADLPAGHPLLEHGFLVALSPSSALVVMARRQENTRDLWEVAISESPELARQLLRHGTELIDGLEGGVRHAARAA